MEIKGLRYLGAVLVDTNDTQNYALRLTSLHGRSGWYQWTETGYELIANKEADELDEAFDKYCREGDE